MESIEIGGLRFSDVTAGSRNYKATPRLAELDGILGLELFDDYLVTLDFPGKLVRFERGELPEADGKEILDYKIEQGVPTVELSIGATKISAHIDSGNRNRRVCLAGFIGGKSPSLVGRNCGGESAELER